MSEVIPGLGGLSAWLSVVSCVELVFAVLLSLLIDTLDRARVTGRSSLDPAMVFMFLFVFAFLSWSAFAFLFVFTVFLMLACSFVSLSVGASGLSFCLVSCS